MKNIYSEMTRDVESSPFATGHIKANLFVQWQDKELFGKTGHLGHELLIHTVINNLEDTPILASLHNLLANLFSTTTHLVDSGQRNHRDLIAEFIVRNLWTLVFIPNEAQFQGLLLSQVSQISLGRWCHSCLWVNLLTVWGLRRVCVCVVELNSSMQCLIF